MSRFACLLAALSLATPTQAEDLDYHVTDPALKVVRLDSSPDDSFLSVRLDTEGRIFVGGRKTLFAYDLDDKGLYQPRKLLMEFPDHTWVNDIEIRGDDLYIVTVSAVYRLPDARTKRDGLTIERLLWGVPNGHVHQCFHACAWGPEGDLYVSMGDPLWYYGDFSRPDHWGHWTMFFKPGVGSTIVLGTPSGPPKVSIVPDKIVSVGGKEWATMPYNGVGAVFRIRPDGTNLRSFSRGLRNPCGLCFDKNWNLFTNDNDHEGLPSMYAPGRLLHVTEGSYFSWPRGWLQSKSPDRADILPAVNSQMGRAVPVLQTYYADGYLPATYDNSLMVARWCRRQVTYFPLRSTNATFEAEERVLLEGRDQARPVGVCVGRGGRVFVTMCYMAQNEGSPVYRSDLAVITRKNDSDSMPFDKIDVTKADPKQMWNHLMDQNWSRRKTAHQEVERRDLGTADWLKEGLKELQRGDTDPLAIPELKRRLVSHLIYLSSHYQEAALFAVLTDRPALAEPFLINLDSDLALVMGHLADAWFLRFDPTKANDRDTRTLLCNNSYRIFRGLGRVPPYLPSPTIFVPCPSIFTWFSKAPRPFDENAYALWGSLITTKNASYRITGAHFGAQQVPSSLYRFKCQSLHSEERLGGVLTAGFRLTIPPVDAVLPDAAPLAPQQKEEANIILYADEKEPLDLRKFGRVGNYTIAEHWKALKHTEEQEHLFALLLERLDDKDDKVRLQAAHFLSLLNDPRSEPKIALVTADVQDKRLNLAKLEHLKPVVWMLGPVPDAEGFKTEHLIETVAIDLTTKYQIAGKSFEWKQTKTTSPDRPLYDFNLLFGPSPNSSVYSFFRFDTPTAQRMQLLVGSEDGVKIWQNGRLIFENDAVRPLIQLDDVVTLNLQPGSNDILVRVHMKQGLGGQYFHYRHLGDVTLSIPDKPDGLSLAERLKAAGTGSQPIAKEFLDVDWSEAMKSGDIARGKKLFAAESLGCAKCHAATASQAGGGGPSLADAGKRFTVPYLVESVLAPNKVISPVFKSTIVETKDGKVITGLVVVDTAEKLEILQPDTKRIAVQKSDIETRKLTDVSAMPQGVVKTPQELRDVIAYLISNPTPEENQDQK